MEEYDLENKKATKSLNGGICIPFCLKCTRFQPENTESKLYKVVFSIESLRKTIGHNNFLIADFFHLLSVSTTHVVHLELRISPRVFEKIRNGPNGILRGLEKLILEKKLEVENLSPCSKLGPETLCLGTLKYVLSTCTYICLLLREILPFEEHCCIFAYR
jgi:hypothetical protein